MHEAMVMGRRFTANEAEARGLVSRKCPLEELLPTSFELCRQLTTPQPYDRRTLAAMKQDIYSWCFDVDLDIPESKL